MEKDRWDVTKGIILTAFSMMMVLTVGLTATACWMMLRQVPIPELLGTLTTSAISFMFGSLASMVKDFVTDKTM